MMNLECRMMNGVSLVEQPMFLAYRNRGTPLDFDTPL